MNWMKGSFQTRHQIKLWCHLVALALAAIVTGIAGGRMIVTQQQMKAAAAASGVTGNGGRRSLSGQIALSMGAKSLMFITYELVSGHTKFLKERLKVNMILSCIEVVAWPAVVAFTVKGIIKRCVGTTCILSWVLVPLAVAMSLLSTIGAYIAVGDWLYLRKNGVKPKAAAFKEELAHAAQWSMALAKLREYALPTAKNARIQPNMFALLVVADPTLKGASYDAVRTTFNAWVSHYQEEHEWKPDLVIPDNCGQAGQWDTLRERFQNRANSLANPGICPESPTETTRPNAQCPTRVYDGQLPLYNGCPGGELIDPEGGVDGRYKFPQGTPRGIDRAKAMLADIEEALGSQAVKQK
ncbi:hypothetical protein V502_00657 [Pseudogymnoascus sp. VKM F-4520 (FW-2644)]|nr:hypothetical protein V502_00657 [Pseudogymnoascus sp. VKM F-4520 (FW-2644)]